jgi:hypothetical protein
LNFRKLWHRKQQFRAALCGHKAIEAGAVCLLLMVQGQLGAVTLLHVEIATKTGLLAVSPAVALTFTRYARYLANRWTSSAFFAICTFLADAAVHESHYPGEYTEAAMTALGAFVFSVAVSYTPIGKKIDELSEHFLHPAPAAE